MVALLAALSVLSPPSGHVLRTEKPGDGVVVPNTAAFELSQDLTVEAWIKPEPTKVGRVYQFIVSKNYEGTGFALLLISTGDDARLQFEANDIVSHSIPERVLENNWWHVAGVFRSADRMDLYVNGVLAATKRTTHRMIPNQMPLSIATSLWEGFAGQLDNVRIWKVARTQEQILADSQRTIVGKEPGLVASWDFERYGHGLVYDRSKGTKPGKIEGQARVIRRK